MVPMGAAKLARAIWRIRSMVVLRGWGFRVAQYDDDELIEEVEFLSIGRPDRG